MFMAYIVITYKYRNKSEVYPYPEDGRERFMTPELREFNK